MVVCMQKALYPLQFEPIFKKVVWGGNRLRQFLGKEQDPAPTGEAWVLSDQGTHASEIANGPLRGITIRDLLLTRGAELIGSSPDANGRFPLLLKFLDARENLSVQVHPNDHQARRMDPNGCGSGKTEAWVILDALPGSTLYAGLLEGVDQQTYQQALRTGTLPNLLHTFEPRPGDCIFLEAGTVHAIGSGLFLFEVQQTSDITYRLYDWDRVEAHTGQPRTLHIDEGVACTDYSRGPQNPVAGVTFAHGERLVDCPYFTLDRRNLSSPQTITQNNRFRILVCIQGSAILSDGTHKLTLTPGTVTLIPACTTQVQLLPCPNITLLDIQ